jgi:hypothetical protein
LPPPAFETFSRFVSFQALALGKIFLRSSRLKPFLAHGAAITNASRPEPPAPPLPWRGGKREPRRPQKRHAVGDGFDHEQDDEQNPVEIVNRMPLFEPRGNRKPERKPR